ncbi:hypothetical protein FRX31_034078 [Thalictrum thalictroides]|uniref:Uncharacterized protein n=1 Tax=Thalictrum thalictroides TaxID=46969 RepID=A0A7J6UVW3_THATH|nr:hypothetical protein FRX31_034078 [Thalictrum thalictroides]
MQMARLGGKRKRTWRIRVMPKLKLGLKCMSPLKMLARLRDGYISMMVGLEGKVGALNGNNFFGAKRLNPKADKSSKVSKAEEFEAKLIFEIYKSLMASRQLVSQNSIKAY